MCVSKHTAQTTSVLILWDVPTLFNKSVSKSKNDVFVQDSEVNSVLKRRALCSVFPSDLNRSRKVNKEGQLGFVTVLQSFRADPLWLGG